MHCLLICRVFYQMQPFILEFILNGSGFILVNMFGIQALDMLMICSVIFVALFIYVRISSLYLHLFLRRRLLSPRSYDQL